MSTIRIGSRTSIKRRLSVAFCLAAFGIQIVPHAAGAQGSTPADARIAAMVAAVSPQRLRATDERLVAFGTRNLYSDPTNKTRGVGAARDWLVAQFKTIAENSGGRMSVRVQQYLQPKNDRIVRPVEVASVLATLRGDDPEAGIVIISGHYDSRDSDGSDPLGDAPGADDNGSGTCAVLEAARVMAHQHFRATIVFAEYDGEEQGLFGSSYHAKTLHAAGATIEGMLNNDIIGTSIGHDGVRRPNGVRIFSEALAAKSDPRRVNYAGNESDSPSRELARFVKESAEEYVPPMRADLIYRADRWGRGGDHQSFNAEGYPAIRFAEPDETWEHQHQSPRIENGIEYADLIKFMDFDYLARVTRMNVAGAAALALGPPRPAHVTLLARGFTYDTILAWKPVPSATGYELVWRAFTDPTWMHARALGNVTTVNAKDLNKDDYIFGIRSVNAAGLRSPVVFPTPIR